jgi:hypothetical protein
MPVMLQHGFILVTNGMLPNQVQLILTLEAANDLALGIIMPTSRTEKGRYHRLAMCLMVQTNGHF